MTICERPWMRLKTQLALAAFCLGLPLLGCHRADTQPEPATVDKPGADSTSTPKEPEQPKQAIDPKWVQTFTDATRQTPPLDWQPFDQTITGKSVGKLYEDVKNRWDNSRLINEYGTKLITYRAALETDLGTIDVMLRPDWAPNHVRNFIALTNASYYDGLLFERIHKEQSEVLPNERLELVEAGCPKGDGSTGSGSIGYWLKPEFNAKATHEIGTLGAIHEQEADTAATRFYITLGKAPLLDGNFTAFGQVTQGLDIARRIFEQPAQPEEATGTGNYRPLKPITIRKVTLFTTEIDAPPPVVVPAESAAKDAKP